MIQLGAVGDTERGRILMGSSALPLQYSQRIFCWNFNLMSTNLLQQDRNEAENDFFFFSEGFSDNMIEMGNVT